MIMAVKIQFKTDIVKRYEDGESLYQIAEDEECNYSTVLRELKRKGINTGLMFWPKKEIEKLKKLYPVIFEEELLKGFPNRTKKSIEATARKLGLKKRKSPISS